MKETLFEANTKKRRREFAGLQWALTDLAGKKKKPLMKAGMKVRHV